MKLEKQVGKKAFDYHKAGFHCAEAVIKEYAKLMAKE